MNSSSDAAESIVRMSLQGLEVAARITGSGAKNISVLLYTIMKEQKQTKGKTKLTNMLKSGKPLKVFTIKQEDLKKFSEEAKRYGVLYCLLAPKSKASPDGMLDIMVRSEDSAKINRIVERFKLSTINQGEIDSIIGKKEIKKALNEAKDKGVEVKDIEDKILDEILTKPIQKEEATPENPNLTKTEKSPQSVFYYENKKCSEEGSRKLNKPSVKKELQEIKEELETKVNKKNNSKTKNINSNVKKKKKRRER